VATGATLRIRRKAGMVIAAHRRRSCEDKVRHATMEAANEVRTRMQDQFGSAFASYPCKYCMGWHVGNDKEAK
jgi:hypothetical protein